MSVLCGFALLAAMTCLALFFQEKKRNEKRRAALVRLIQEECGHVGGIAEAERERLLADFTRKIQAMEARIQELEKGVIPDYEQARRAVDEVNKFNEGLSNMLGFDPLESMKKARNGTGGER